MITWNGYVIHCKNDLVWYLTHYLYFWGFLNDSHSSTITLEAAEWFFLLLNVFFLWSDSFPSTPMNDFIFLPNQCYFIDSLEAKMFFFVYYYGHFFGSIWFYQVYFGLQFSQGLSKNWMQRDGNLYLGIKFTFKADCWDCSKKLLAL